MSDDSIISHIVVCVQESGGVIMNQDEFVKVSRCWFDKLFGDKTDTRHKVVSLLVKRINEHNSVFCTVKFIADTVGRDISVVRKVLKALSKDNVIQMYRMKNDVYRITLNPAIVSFKNSDKDWDIAEDDRIQKIRDEIYNMEIGYNAEPIEFVPAKLDKEWWKYNDELGDDVIKDACAALEVELKRNIR